MAPDIVRLGISSGLERYTTKEMFELEEKLLAHAEALRQNPSHQISADTVLHTLSVHGELAEEQMKALWHITIGEEVYFLSWDGFLMPAKKDQPPPDLKYFPQVRH